MMNKDGDSDLMLPLMMLMMGNQQPGGANNSMLPMMMLMNKDGDLSDIMPLMLLMGNQGPNQNNMMPMIMMMMMNKKWKGNCSSTMTDFKILIKTTILASLFKSFTSFQTFY